MTKQIFITGIGTSVGKTVASAIVCQSLGADYWKPIQAGDLDHGDKHEVASLISDQRCFIHPNQFALNSPMSPHAAAEIDQVQITAEAIKRPKTTNHLVIEGAGGLLVPINQTETIMDLLKPDDHVIVVSRHYLGSINHSLMTIKLLQQAQFRISVIFNGNHNPATENVIKNMTDVDIIGRIDELEHIDKNTVNQYAEAFFEALSQ